MNLKDFEKQIPSEILKRGYSYFNNKHIISLEEEESGIWFAQVEGNENYNVTEKRKSQASRYSSHMNKTK